MHPDLFYELSKKYNQPVEDVEFKILEAMTTYGGSFVVALSHLYRLADPINERKLADTFDDYFIAYGQKVYGGKKLQVRPRLTKNQYKILVLMDNEYAYYYSYFESETKLDRATLKKEMAELRRLGLVIHQKGIFDIDGDGMVAGSGHSITYEKTKEVKELIEDYEKNGGDTT